jgi:tetratricopeptide (TPR) repeat protein
MGVVYIVYDRDGREALAAKTFQDEVFARNPLAVERFKREAFAWVNLDIHENIAQARFVETINGKPFLFLEYVSGGDLQSWIGTPRLTADLGRVLQFGIQFCDGMTHASSKGVKVHRDIKPQNCLVTEDFTLKVTDFGLAKIVEDEADDSTGLKDNKPQGFWQRVFGHEAKVESADGLSQTGATAGTPVYMSPEQFVDFKHVDVRADIYSFGVMFFQMIAGHLPFKGRSWLEFAQLHQSQSPPTKLIPNREAARIIERCLAKKPSDRFQDFSELRASLASAYGSVTKLTPPAATRGTRLDAANWSWKSVSLWSLDMPDEALAAADRSLALDAALPAAWIAKGCALQNLGRLEESATSYDRALALNPESAVAWANKDLLMKQRGDLQEGLACQKRALALQPLNEKTWANKGSALFDLGRFTEGLEAFDHALELNPHYANGWFNKGSLLQESGEYAKAVDCYRRAVTLNPRLDYAWFRMGVALEQLEKFEEAIHCYDRVLELNPRDVLALANKGGIFQDRKQSAEALKCLDRALEIDRKNATVWFNKGSLLIDLKRFKEAIASLEEAKKLGASDAARGIAFCQQMVGGDGPEELSAKALQELGSGRVQEALNLLDQALLLAPQSARAWLNKGVCLVHLNQAQQALECFNKSLALEPDLSEAWINKGAALGELGKHREALDCFLQAKRLGLPQADRAIAICRKNLGL